MRRNEEVEVVERELRSAGVPFTVEPNSSGHPTFRFEVNGERKVMSVPGTGSDCKNRVLVKTKVRRLLRGGASQVVDGMKLTIVPQTDSDQVIEPVIPETVWVSRKVAAQILGVRDGRMDYIIRKGMVRHRQSEAFKAGLGLRKVYEFDEADCKAKAGAVGPRPYIRRQPDVNGQVSGQEAAKAASEAVPQADKVAVTLPDGVNSEISKLAAAIAGPLAEFIRKEVERQLDELTKPSKG